MISFDSGIFLRASDDSISLEFATIKSIAASFRRKQFIFSAYTAVSTTSPTENFRSFTYHASASIFRFGKPYLSAASSKSLA